MKQIFIFLAVLLAGCTEPFDIRTDNSPPVVVIYGELTNELKHQEVNVSRSSPYFDDEPNKGISGAIVTVNAFSFTEHDTIPGLYLSDTPFAVDSLVTYSLSVRVEG